MAALVDKVRTLLLGPFSSLPYVRVEGWQVLGQPGAPVLKLYAWVETPPSSPILHDLRVQLTSPHADSAHVELRLRRNEEAPISLPLDTGGISPRLTVLAHLTRPLSGPVGVLKGRVAASARPGSPVRWTRFEGPYRWDLQVARPAEAAPGAEEGKPEPQPALAGGDQPSRAEAHDA